MGQFSWYAQDYPERIICVSKEKDKRGEAYLHDNKGNVWYEPWYEGYGVFGGKDFYVLIAEMNNLNLTGNPKIDREVGITLYYSGEPFLSPNITKSKHWTWINEIPEDDPKQGAEQDETD